MTYRKSLVACLVILMCGCASKPTRQAKPTQQDLERAEIQRLLDQASVTNTPILRTCQSLVTDLEKKPVDLAPVLATATIVVAMVVLVPLIIASGAKGVNISDFKGGSGGSGDSGGGYDHALARDRITARCVVAVATEQRLGPDHADMAVPLVRLGEAYQLASIDPKGPAAQQAQRLLERALSVVEKQLDRVEKDEEYGKQIEGALTSYISVLQKLNRDWRPLCSRVRRLQTSLQCSDLRL